MGKQIDFYMMPEELKNFALQAINEMNAIVISPQSKTKKLNILPSAFVTNSDELPLTLMLARPNDLKFIIPELLQKNDWRIRARPNLLIEFGRCYMDKTVIREGGVFYEYRYLENGEYHYKPEDFIKWAEKIFRLLRKHLVKYDDGRSLRYIGKQTFEWLKNNKYTFKFSDGLVYK